MDIEKEIQESFEWAVVRVATYYDILEAKPKLLFGSVSLLAPGRPCPASGELESIKLDGGKRGKVFFRKAVLTARDAIAWYRQAESSFLVPRPFSESERSKHDAAQLALSPLTDNPIWPNLGLPVNDAISPVANSLTPDLFPLLGKSYESVRIHRRFSPDSSLDSILSDERCHLFLRRRLHIDLREYFEYLGGLVLIVPNPIIENIESFVIPNSNGEKLVFQLIPRVGKSLKDLNLTTFEFSEGLLTRFETSSVPLNGVLILPRAQLLNSVGYFLLHRTLGLLVHQPPHTFVRSVQVDFDLRNRRISVESPISEKLDSKRVRFDIDELLTKKLTLGEEPANVDRVFAAKYRRQVKAHAIEDDQTWFDKNERERSIQFVRSRISRARSSVLIADPYFGARQLTQFAHAVIRQDLEITILTSRLAFDSSEVLHGVTARGNESTTIDGLAKSAERQRLVSFDANLRKFMEREFRRVSVLIMGGSKPELHDRFLVVDANVWFLGNSLNTLGERASLVLKVPDGEEVLKKLEALLGKSQEFSKFFGRRLKSLGENNESL